MKKIIAIIALTAGLLAAASEGWDNINPERSPASVGEILWRGKLTAVEYRDGAKGKVEHIGDVIKVTKDNDEGYILVRTAEPVEFPAGKFLQLVIPMRTSNAAPDYSLGMVRLLKNLKKLPYDKSADVRSSAGPAMQFMFNTPENVWLRRIAHTKTDKKNSSVYPALIVGGKQSVSFWQEPWIEDYHVAAKKFKQSIRKKLTYDHDMMDEAEFDKMLVSAKDHTAKVAVHNGAPTLFVDGVPQVPALYKAKNRDKAEQNYHAGKLFLNAGMDIHVVSVRYGNFLNKFHNLYGVWSKDGFDVEAAVRMIKNSMRTAPEAKFVITLIMHPAYPEFGAQFPDEVWVNGSGKTVYGHYTHAQYFLQDEMPARYVPWPSYNSLVWRDMVKKHTAELIAELKKQNLSKKIIGVHLAGGHDAQYSMRHMDYSKPALAAFKEFLKKRYVTVDALRQAWGEKDVTFDTVTMPDYPRKAVNDMLDPVKDRKRIDFFIFQKEAPFRMQEDIGRAIKKEFGKEIVLMRWCMAAFGGDFGAALDIGAFMDSKVIDVLIAQSPYNRRFPGLPHGVRQPLTSYRLNGKLYLQELDLRTWLGSTSSEDELRVLSSGVAQDLPMWYTVNRKIVGQMVAERLGYWYYDMAGGWYDDPAINADMKSQIATEKFLRSQKVRPWQASAAFVVDEEGLFLRNFPGNYYMFDAGNLIAQQNQLLATGAVPYDFILLRDLLKDPARAKNYRTLVFAGMFHIDSVRMKFLKQLQNSGRTLVFLSGSGRMGGCREATGFTVTTLPPPQRDRVIVSTVNDGINQLNWADLRVQSQTLGEKTNSYYLPRKMVVAREENMSVPAVFRKDNVPAVAVKQFPSWRSVYIAEAGGLTPEYFNHLVKTSGGYVVSRPGVQADMNGNFISLHGIVSGRYTIDLPMKSTVRNLKTNRVMVRDAKSFTLDVTAGSTYWFSLE